MQVGSLSNLFEEEFKSIWVVYILCHFKGGGDLSWGVIRSSVIHFKFFDCLCFQSFLFCICIGLYCIGSMVVVIAMLVFCAGFSSRVPCVFFCG